MENNTVQNVVHGFKVFRPDWTCDPTGYNPKQYTCPGKFEEEGELDVCGHGMHFCQTAAADCFNYYSFNSENKVAEVIAYGEVRTEGDKSCTDKLEIVREIPWDEVLRIVNLGKNCTDRQPWKELHGSLQHREQEHREQEHREQEHREQEQIFFQYWLFQYC